MVGPADHMSGFHEGGRGMGLSALPSCTQMGLSLGIQPKVPLKYFIHSLFVEPFNLNPSWQWNRVTELSKNTPPLGVLKPFSGTPGSAHTWRSSNPILAEKKRSLWIHSNAKGLLDKWQTLYTFQHCEPPNHTTQTAKTISFLVHIVTLLFALLLEQCSLEVF